MKLNVTGCYALAWRSFAKWWIPICVLSGIIVVTQIVPRLMVHAELGAVVRMLREFVTAISEQDVDRAAELAPELSAQVDRMTYKVLRLGGYLFPLVALVTAALLMYANRAVKERPASNAGAGRLIYVAWVHVLLALAKALAFACFVLPGIYVYVRLVFVSLIMLEEGGGAGRAMRRSWELTAGHFWELFLLLLLNTVIQAVLMPTVIGAIPATGFVNTARAAAFRMLLDAETPGRQMHTDGDEEEHKGALLRQG